MLRAQWREIVEAADVPQALDRSEIAAARAHFHVARQMLEHRAIDRLRRCAQHRLRGRLREVGQKLVERAEARGWIAPEQAGARREMMDLDRVNLLGRDAGYRQAHVPENPGPLVAVRDPRAYGT